MYKATPAKNSEMVFGVIVAQIGCCDIYIGMFFFWFCFSGHADFENICYALEYHVAYTKEEVFSQINNRQLSYSHLYR